MSSRESLLLPSVLALFVAAVVVIGVRGDFPLSDDWAYAHVVRSLVEGRGYDLLPWTGASLVVQALYGALACKVAGFSHTVLRATTVAMALFGIASMHALLRELGATTRTAAAGALALAFSPLWLNLSFTFMTDVPFVALSIAGAALTVRGLQRESRAALLGAGAVIAAAFLVRQHAVWIAAAAALAALLPASRAGRATELGGGATSKRADGPILERADGATPRTAGARIVDAACVASLPLVAAIAWTLWVTTGDSVPLAVHNKLGEAAGAGAGPMLNAAFRATATAGFLLLPWAWASRPRDKDQRRAFVAALLALLAVAAFAWMRDGAAMFYLTNVLADFTVGAVTTRDALFLGIERGPLLGPAARAALTLASLASAAVVGARIATGMGPAFSRLEPSAASRSGSSAQAAALPSRAAVFVVAALLLTAAGSLVQAHWYFDRYVLALLPLAAAALAALQPGLRCGAGFLAATAALGLYGVAGTHDYMEWNRARWALLASLEADGVDAASIDGGVEYNAERRAALMRTAPGDSDARKGQDASRKSWWWVQDDEWIVAFGPLDGYAVHAARDYPRWLPPGQDRVLVLHRN